MLRCSGGTNRSLGTAAIARSVSGERMRRASFDNRSDRLRSNSLIPDFSMGD